MANDHISAGVSHGTTKLGDSTEALLLKSLAGVHCIGMLAKTRQKAQLANIQTKPCPGCKSSHLPNATGVRHRRKPWMRLRQALCQGSLRSSPRSPSGPLRVRSRVSKRGWSCRSEKLGLWLVSFNSVRKVRVDLCRRAAVFGCFC